MVGMPLVRNGRYFFSKRLASHELSVICMRKGLGGKDEVLIDPHPLSPDRITSINLLDVSRDGTLLAYGARRGGEDEIAIGFFDVDRRKELPDSLPRARYFCVSLKPDKSGLYYSRYGPNGSRVYYRTMGQDTAGDIEIFGKGYWPDKIISARLSEDGRYLLIPVSDGARRSEIYYQDVARS